MDKNEDIRRITPILIREIRVNPCPILEGEAKFSMWVDDWPLNSPSINWLALTIFQDLLPLCLVNITNYNHPKDKIEKA